MVAVWGGEVFPGIRRLLLVISETVMPVDVRWSGAGGPKMQETTS